MNAAASRVKEHQVVFCGLEVLRLIGERMENDHEVDDQDVRLVLSFMEDVAHRCLNNTEDLLQFFALEDYIAKHRHARSAFERLTRTEGREFALGCRQYADLLASVIFEDRRCVSSLDCDPVALSQFYEWEREIADLARTYGQTLHRLEMKYTTPHCI